MGAIDLARQLKTKFGDILSEPSIFADEVTLTVMDPEKIHEVCLHARDHLGFDYLVDISSVDEYDRAPRWTLVYEITSVAHHCMLRLKTAVSEESSELPTVSSLWRTADWHEREIFDMMGIRFRQHPDLRRILMWDEFEHYPLRKDFPLAGKGFEIPGTDLKQSVPLEGGPFVTEPGCKHSTDREPRSRDFKNG